jgi:hypothetical protein
LYVEAVDGRGGLEWKRLYLVTEWKRLYLAKDCLRGYRVICLQAIVIEVGTSKYERA